LLVETHVQACFTFGVVDVRRLQVAVDDPALVRGLERLGDLSGPRRWSGRTHCAARGRTMDSSVMLS
jgi:hypothetical protein